jgi:regulator of RNase E activity RraA
MKNKIIDFIKRNRVSTTEVADAMDKTGAINGINCINRGKFSVGNVYFVYSYGETNWDLHKQIENVKENDIVFIHTYNTNNRAVAGELVAKYLLLYKQATAIVVDGLLRDTQALIKENWPIWCKGFTPIGCFNKQIKHNFEGYDLESFKDLYHNSIAVCDDTGVVIIPKKHHNEQFLKRLIEIENQEDIWFDCIDRKKYSTFETVCLKKDQ